MLTFVLADDKFPPRMYAKAALREIGEIVGEAVNGQEAIDLCEKLRPDVVILDISMPVKTGAEAAHEIIKAGTARFVVMATSLRQSSVINPLLAIGCHEVTKPYEKPVLRAQILKIVGADGKA